MPDPDFRALAHSARERIIEFAQRLLRAPSFTGQEGEAAELVLQEIERLGYDEAITDSAGNVIGRLKGGSGGRVLLHAHLDVVDTGDASRWRYAPFAGEVHGGYLWGRGASDDKGCVVAQVYALGLLRQAGLTPPGDVYLAAVVGEEVGGIGTRYLSRHFRPDVAVIGEPSHNTLRRGHRGRFEFIVTFRGRSAHASVPHEGRNPHYALARFLLALREAPLAEDVEFGGTTVAPTLIRCDQSSSNVIPAELRVHLDWRNAPHETPAQAQALLERLLAEHAEPDIETLVTIRSQTVTSYTGYQEIVQHAVRPFVMASDDPFLLAAQGALEAALQRPLPVEVWPFFTDGGFLYAQGIPCLGFGPGEETMAHVLDERLSIEQLLEATAGYMALAMTLGDVARQRG